MRRGAGKVTEVLSGAKVTPHLDCVLAPAEDEALARGWATSIEAATRDGAKEKNASASTSICAKPKQLTAGLKLIPTFEMHAAQSGF